GNDATVRGNLENVAIAHPISGPRRSECDIAGRITPIRKQFDLSRASIRGERHRSRIGRHAEERQKEIVAEIGFTNLESWCGGERTAGRDDGTVAGCGSD